MAITVDLGDFSHTVTFNSKISMSVRPYMYTSSPLILYSVGKTSRKQSSAVRRENALPREERYSCKPCHQDITVTSLYNINLLKLTGYLMHHQFNPLKPELNPICYLLALLGAHHFLHVSRMRVKLLTFRLLMSYIYGAPILDVSRSHTTTQHSR